MTAYGFASKPSEPRRLSFGMDCANAGAALRKLADEFESGKVAIESVRVQSLASADDFPATLLRIKFHEPKP